MSSAAFCTCSSTQPASTVIVSFNGSVDRTAFIRPSDSTISSPPSNGTDPPQSEVLPPCGTTLVPVSLQIFRISATSAAVPGRRISGLTPR